MCQKLDPSIESVFDVAAFAVFAAYVHSLLPEVHKKLSLQWINMGTH
jgi:hypothetical protein